MSTLSKQCRQKAEADGYASLMNNTKWREVCLAFAAYDKKPAWRACDLLTGYISPWDTDWFHHVGPDYCAIEWLEIDPRDGDEEEIRATLALVGVRLDDSNGIRILGYKRSEEPNQTPDPTAPSRRGSS